MRYVLCVPQADVTHYYAQSMHGITNNYIYSWGRLP